ncbi:MAG: CDP-diacylglycerol--glycerol-3-phosphate 3-phosphatidyltransferase [Candidatus Zixiibacteriota bacterium]|nr:MAG: CDP-diacylglycerol--glycerol-3-phosphate 3-phosphatidyltransferase [candidate division Zixibacteria bacterium]
MNTPNKLTLLRIIIAPIFMFFFLVDNFPMQMVALGLFVIAALTDLADGYYARKYGVITGFGKFMDPLADKILVSSALISFIALRYVSPLPVILIIGREFSITGLRLLAAYRGVVISPTRWAKVKTFLQLSIVGVVLAYIALKNALTYYGNDQAAFLDFDYYFYFNLVLWITAVITVATGVDYGVKYFYMIKSVLK